MDQTAIQHDPIHEPWNVIADRMLHVKLVQLWQELLNACAAVGIVESVGGEFRIGGPKDQGC